MRLFSCIEEQMEFLIDRTELPYDAMVNDAAWLIPIKKDGDGTHDAETEKIQADEVPGEGLPL